MLPEGFVYLDEAVRGIRWDARYAGDNNFLGRPADGYRVNRVVCSLACARALIPAQKSAEEEGLGLFVFDAYRPERAVRDFCAWAEKENDTVRKAIHYPGVDKAELISQGYIAKKSGHSRGSSVDLTLCRPDGTLLDMGGIFDLMDPVSWHGSPLVTPAQTENRELLRRIMLNCGFEDYDKEWWHYRLKDEPFRETYFDFVIE